MAENDDGHKSTEDMIKKILRDQLENAKQFAGRFLGRQMEEAIHDRSQRRVRESVTTGDNG